MSFVFEAYKKLNINKTGNLKIKLFFEDIVNSKGHTLILIMV